MVSIRLIRRCDSRDVATSACRLAMPEPPPPHALISSVLSGVKNHVKHIPRALIGLAATLAALGSFGCSPVQSPAGQLQAPTPPPTVAVSGIHAHAPGQVGGAYRIEATINHTTSGGPADITFRLRNKTTSEIIESSGGVNLTPGVALAAVAELRAPEGDYTPEVEVKYPAR